MKVGRGMNKNIWSVIGYFLFWILAIYVAVKLAPVLLALVIIAGLVLGGVILYLRHKMNKVVDNFNDTINDTFNIKDDTNNSTSESFEDYDVDESNVIDVDFTEVKKKDE